MRVLPSCDWLAQDLVEYYKQYSLKEGFSTLDTTLQVPYREPSNESKTISKTSSGESHKDIKLKVSTGNYSEYLYK